jgi:NADPH:quinone reductase-like Zn-dependent oxidoreductase
VTTTAPPEAQPPGGKAIFFIVEANRDQLNELARRVRKGRLRTIIGKVAPLDEAVAAFNPSKRVTGKTIIRVRP